jgi:amino acid adenylation domain-containing protein
MIGGRASDNGASDLGSALLGAARQHRDRPALWSKGVQLSYGDLFGQAGGIAQSLIETGGVVPGTRVAILSDRTSTAYISILAALLAGAAYVPLNPRFPLQRNRQILEESGATILLCDDKHRLVTEELIDGVADLNLIIFPEGGAIAGIDRKQISASDLSLRDLQHPSPCETACGELAYIFFTSGSTGKPKGVPISHANVFAYLSGIRSICSPLPADRVLQLVDLTFDLSVHDMFLCWSSGACLYSVPENAALLCTRFVSEHDITYWLSVPSTAGLIRQSGLLEPASMPTLRQTFFCGEPLTGAVAEAWAEAAPNSLIDNIYGPTEATVAFSSFRYMPGQASPPSVVPLGKPFPGQEMALFSDDGERQPEFGEICLAGSQVMDGYWQAPEITAMRMFDADGKRWYRTGDLGRYDENRGYLYAGRSDHQVKIRGYRVELQEIEHVVRLTAQSDLVAVLPWSDITGGPTMGCAAFALNPRQAESEALAGCRERLPEYMVPSRIFSVAEMPFNSNGKVDYVELRSHPFMAAFTGTRP